MEGKKILNSDLLDTFTVVKGTIFLCSGVLTL